ncbi:MAG: S41 family peptidase [Candidatus Nomurabacteria bacterium]|nr:MAG: S41 family peptidase [Candidatus Nomurabacteria bacterium]
MDPYSFRSESLQTRQRRFIGGLLLLVIGFGLGWWLRTPHPDTLEGFLGALERVSGSKSSTAVFESVWNTIKQDYLHQPVTNDELIEGAIAGMVNSLSDPYTIYLSSEQTKDFLGDIQGNFEGIGAEIGIKKDRLTVIAPLPDSPAAKAGVRAGDVILAIDDQPADFLTLTQAVDMLRGAKDTTVQVTVQNGDEDARTLTITRDAISVKSVKAERKTLENGKEYAFISISSFSDTTQAELHEAISDMILDSPDGIVLDLRNNPGGYLQAGIDVASVFLNEGDTVLFEEKGDGQRISYSTTGKHELKDLPVVVLVNEGTASAAEIVAGALRDDDGSQLVGVTTFGKGSVQDFIQLENGASVKITVARWLTPNGTSIDQSGLDPDQNVELTQDDYDNDRDPQLEAALQTLFPSE